MTKVKLGDVAIEYKQAYQGNRESVPNVGLEHLIPSEVKLSCWNTDNDNTFTKRFNKGQVLLGRRRAYLKKAVVAPFDGICSSDITVIEAVPNKISPELLPFIIQNERFFNYAIKGSAGSLSPRVKWEYLKEYEFDLPPIEEQERLAELLWAAYDLKESYKKLIAAIDEMVKAEFIKINTEAHLNNSKEKTIAEISESVFAGGDKPKDYSDIQTSLYQYPVYSNGEINDGLLCFSKNYRVAEKALTVSARGNIGYVCIRAPFFTPVVRLLTIIPKKDVNITYLKYTLNHHTFSSTGSSQGQLTLPNFKKVKFYIPSLQEQSLFDTFAQQADKSKAELQQSSEHIDKVMRSLLP